MAPLETVPNELAAAQAAYRDAVARQVDAGPALLRLGLAFKAAGNPTAALEAFLQASRSPAAGARGALEAGLVFVSLQRPGEAIAWLQRAVERAPGDTEASFRLGDVLLHCGRVEEALAPLERARQIDPSHIEVLRSLVMANEHAGRPEAALSAARALAERTPDDANVFLALARLRIARGEAEEAGTDLARAVALAGPDAGVLMQAARLRTALQDGAGAIAALEAAKAAAPARADLRIQYAAALTAMGRFEAAEQELRAVLEREPLNASACFELAQIHSFGPGDSLIAAMEDALEKAGVGQAKRQMHYALGKAFDDADDPARAFAHFKAANDGAASQFREQEALAGMRQVAEIFSEEMMRRLEGAGPQSALPVFVVGMPRSGSTLVEQILASHPQVAGVGEVDLMRAAVDAAFARLGLSMAARDLLNLTRAQLAEIGHAYLALMDRFARGKARVVNKYLGNTSAIGLIALALPGARIVNCLRDPIDTCFSCYTKPFAAQVGYATDLGALGRYYRAHDALMAHWRRALPEGVMIDVRYEDVVGDLEAEARRIVAHLGLPWHEDCLQFYRAERPVRTSSAAQVRRPIYNSAIGRAQRYFEFLAPLRAALQDEPRRHGA